MRPADDVNTMVPVTSASGMKWMVEFDCLSEEEMDKYAAEHPEDGWRFAKAYAKRFHEATKPR